MTTFSVIIPIYRVEKYITQCIESVLNQTFHDFEVLCVDDCGGDASIKIVEQYAQKDKRIKILYHDKNRGVGAARNTAIKAATGKYTICLDSDDWWERNCLEIIYNAFQKYKTNSIWFDANKYIEETHTICKESVLQNREGYLTVTPDNISHLSDYCFKAYLTEGVKKYNIFYPEGIYFEDGEFYFKFFTYNPVTYIIEDRIYNYRIHESSITQNLKLGLTKVEHIYQVVKNLRQFYIDNDLWDKYKMSILELINIRINTCKNACDDKARFVLTQKLLKEINYPDDFEEFNSSNVPLVSIIIPVYNVEKYIKKCLMTIQGQSYSNLEILCIDDCGNDKSMDIVKQFAQFDNRFRIIRNECNKGLGYSRNVGINNANGEFIFFVDSDDWMNINAVKTVVEKFKLTGLNTIWFKTDMWWEDSKTSDKFYCDYYNNIQDGYFDVDETNIALFTQYVWNKAYRKDFLIDNNIYFQEGRYFEDMDFFFKLFIASPKCYMINNVLYTYRRNSQSIIGRCVKDYTKAIDTYAAANDIYDFLIEKGLYEKYKDMYISFLLDTLNMFRGFPEIHRKSFPTIQKLLDKIL